MANSYKHCYLQQSIFTHVVLMGFTRLHVSNRLRGSLEQNVFMFSLTPKQSQLEWKNGAVEHVERQRKQLRHLIHNLPHCMRVTMLHQKSVLLLFAECVEKLCRVVHNFRSDTKITFIMVLPCRKLCGQEAVPS